MQNKLTPNKVKKSLLEQLATAFEEIFHNFTQRCDANAKYKSYRLLAVDGTDLRLPTDKNNAETYIKSIDTDNKEYSLANLDAGYDLINHIYLDASLQSKRGMNEHQALTTMVDRLNIFDKVIVVADRGYESYNNMAHIQEKGWYFVIRAKESSGIITRLNIPNAETYDVVNELVLTRRQTKESLLKKSVARIPTDHN